MQLGIISARRRPGRGEGTPGGGARQSPLPTAQKNTRNKLIDTVKIMLKYCAICQKPFKAVKKAKYCSEKCKLIGARAARKAWESRTNYREKARINAAKRRQEKEKKKKEAAGQTAENNLIFYEDLRQKKLSALREKISKRSKTFQMMRLAAIENNTVEYWRLRKIWFQENGARPGDVVVGAADPCNDDFIDEIFSELLNDKRRIMFKDPERRTAIIDRPL